MNKEYKKISLCVPCYNSEKYLTDTLNSIKNQTIVPDEIVIINDGLTDGTQSIIESFINENKNWMFYFSHKLT